MSSELPAGDPGLSLTPSAVSYIKEMLNKANKPAIGLRVGVKKAGCSGYEYTLEYAYADLVQDIDYTFEQEDITIVIDKETYVKFLKGGTSLDFTTQGINQGLHFNNPNVGHQCGCGESFTLIGE